MPRPGSFLPVIAAITLLCAGGYAQPSGYTQSAVVTVDHRKVANSDQVNFPLMVVGASPSLKSAANGGSMQDDRGYDILFTADSSGNSPLPYERELHNTATGRIVYWISVPILSHTVDTPIYVWYGNSNISTDQATPRSVWDANYRSVWHLNDSNASTTVADSSAGQHNGVNRANTNLRAVAGKIPNVTALTYNGAPDHMDVNSPAGGDFDFTSGNFTYEFWLKVNSYVVYAPYFGNGIWLKSGYYFQEDGGAHGLQFVSNTSGAYIPYDDKSPGPANTWRHIAVVRQDSNLSIFVNGKLDQSFSNFTSPASSASPFSVGGTAGVGGVQAVIQEFRVSNVNRSADWIATEYANQNNPGNFFSHIPWDTSSALPPVCNAGTSQVFRVGASAVLDGSDSSARDGHNALSYSWQVIPSLAGGVPQQRPLWSSRTAARPSISRFVAGPVDVQLTVTQSDGQASSCVVHDGAVATDQNGIVNVSTGNPHLDDAIYNLLGPMLPLGKNPWAYYDAANQAAAAVQIGNMDTVYGDFWNTPGSGTIAVSPGSLAVVGDGTTFTSTFCQGPGKPTVPIPGIGLIVWYPTNDGTGRTGRRLAGYNRGPGNAFIQSCTDDTHITLSTNAWYANEAACPTDQAPPCWLQYSMWAVPTGNAWNYGAAPANYYDVVSAYYALYYRSGIDTYLIAARKLADRFWSSPEFDLGNAFDPGYPLFGFQPQFRCWSIQGMILRALDNGDHNPDMWPGMHKIWDLMMTRWWLSNFPSNPAQYILDAREWGYGLAQLADCAMYDSSAQYQQTCRNYIKNSFATSGPGALNIWPSRQSANGGWEQFFGRKGSWSTRSTVNLTYGSAVVSCATGNCGWTADDFPAAPQSYVWFTNSSAMPASNAEGDPDAYCYQAGSNATCRFVDSNHFTLDRPYAGADCQSGCTRGWVFGSEGVAGWGQEPFFEGILAFAFDLAGRAMSCTSTNVPAGCDDDTSALAYQANSDAVNWMMTYGYNSKTTGMWYYTLFPGCNPPDSNNNYWCSGHAGTIGSREFAGDGLRGMMVYYQRTGDAKAKAMIDAIYSGLWSKPGTNAMVPSPDGAYDNGFDTCDNNCGYWLSPGATPNKLFGQMFGFGAHYMWPAIRSGGALTRRQ